VLQQDAYVNNANDDENDPEYQDFLQTALANQHMLPDTMVPAPTDF
jgi:hypothetical protein